MGLLSLDGTLLDANSTALEAVGLPLSVVLGQPFWDTPWWTHDPAEQARLRAGIRRAAQGETFEMETTHTTAEGRLLVVSFSIRPIRDGHGRVVALLPEGRDISDLAEERVRLRLSEMRFRALVEHAPEAIVILDPKTGRFIEANAQAEILFKVERSRLMQLSPFHLSPALQPDGRPSAETALAYITQAMEEGIATFEWTHEAVDGERIPCEVRLLKLPSSQGDLVRGSLVDLRPRLAREFHILESERKFRLLFERSVEGLLLLDGDRFTNCNQAVLDMLRCTPSEFRKIHPWELSPPLQPDGRESREKALEMMATAHAKGVHRFEWMHRRSTGEDFNALVQELTDLVKASIGKKVALRFSFEEGLPLVEADEAQIQQVILDLVTNASDAIGDEEGEIRIVTSSRHLDEAHLAEVLPGQGLQPSLYVVLEVADTGSGMAPEVLSRIFDPFFTSKPKGHGLGLSAILGILKGHQAGLKVSSKLGAGTTFQLFFPAASGLALKAEPPTPVTTAPFSGLVLLVDDEESILEVARRALERLGFDVETASDGVEAVEKFSWRPGAYRVALLDLTMPRMNGRECFKALRSLRPDLSVLLCSGYSEQESGKAFLGEGLAGFIQKPYTLTTLKNALSDVLKP